MSYEVIKAFAISLTGLSIRGKYYSSNVTDCRGRRVVEDFEQIFETMEELENKLLVWGNCYLGGTAQFSPNSTFAKRVNWLVENGYVTRGQIADNQEAKDVLAGRKTIKTQKYAYVVRANKSSSGYNLVLKQTKNGIRMSGVGGYKQKLTTEEIVAVSKGTRRLSVLNKNQVDFIKEYHSEFLERYNVELVKLS